LDIKPTDKFVLVARSRCYLAVGDSKSALEDAESALREDKDFFKVIYTFTSPFFYSSQAKFQKAEALYAKGDFEMALVYYHRGHVLRPELDEFRLGIQKAREAIDNSIGSTFNLMIYYI
jgi:tetratricopeptide (TPR) repeat protein